LPRTCAEGRLLRYLFDLTTCAHWGGADVGIVRVEREFARRAREHLGDAVEFCVYDRFRNLVLTLDDAVAADIVAGRIRIDLSPPPTPSAAAAARTRVGELRRQLRRVVLTNATLYHAFQRLRGRSFTREDILLIQTQTFGARNASKDRTGPLPIAGISHRITELDSDALLISGGLDWELKNARALIALKRERNFRYCTIIHDIIPILFPHLVVPHLVPVFERYFTDLIVLADYAMCNSEATRRDWARFSRERGVDMPASVFPLGSDLPAIEGSLSIELPEQLQGKRFALFVSMIEPRKNHRMLYEAWDRCVRSGAVDAERDRLVFVGRHGWSINDLMRELSANPATRETLIVLNHVPDALLRLLYQRCAFVVYPSLYEGYGLPLAEALAYGKPCISSDAGSLPEIGGDLVVRIDPKDTIRWSDTLAHFMRSPQELDERTARIRAEFRPVTWEQAAGQFFSTIKSIGG
jgi:glycosyltransferase involved in cell wall biosynthesis